MNVGRLSFRFKIGRIIREAGESLDRVGSFLQGNLASRERLNRHRRVMNFRQAQPSIAKHVFIAPSAHVIGDVTLGENTSVWYNAVLRGDVNKISIGNNTNIQDRVVVHVTGNDGKPTIIGNNVTIEPGAVIHAAVLHDECYIGVGAIVLDGAVIGSRAIIAPGSVVTPGTKVPAGQLWAGTPAKFVRELSVEEQESTAAMAKELSELAKVHNEENQKDYEDLLRELEQTKFKIDRLEEYAYTKKQ